MPTISQPIGKITDNALKEYQNSNYFKHFYNEDDPIIESLTLIDNGRTKQRPNPPQKHQRKVYEEQVSLILFALIKHDCIGVRIRVEEHVQNRRVQLDL